MARPAQLERVFGRKQESIEEPSHEVLYSNILRQEELSMRFQHSRAMRVAICALIGSSYAFAQSTQTTTYATVSSSYPVAAQTIGNIKFNLSLGVSYPVNLSPGSYISGTQLATDLQNSVSGYSSPTDPPEAIFSSALSSLLAKYPQMTGGTLTASVSPTVSAAGVVTLGPTISVIIGTFTTSGGVLASPNSATVLARPVPSAISPAPAAKGGD